MSATLSNVCAATSPAQYSQTNLSRSMTASRSCIAAGRGAVRAPGRRGYIGQSNQVTVPLGGAVERENCSYFYDDVPAEIVNQRVLGDLMN